MKKKILNVIFMVPGLSVLMDSLVLLYKLFTLGFIMFLSLIEFFIAKNHASHMNGKQLH